MQISNIKNKNSGIAASRDDFLYAINKHLEEIDGAAPADTVLLFETYPGWNQAGGPEILTAENHEGDGCNIVYVNGHVEFVKTQALNDLRWKPD